MTKKYVRTHQELIDCGMQLLFANGFSQVTIMNICDKAGVSRPTFYQHFKGKEHLISEYYESSYFFTDEMRKWVYSAPDRWSAIIRIQMLYIRCTYNVEHMDLVSHYLSYKLMSNSKNAFSNFHSKLEDMLIVLLREAQEAHIIANTSNPYYLCKTIFMMHAGNLFNWCSACGRVDCSADFFWNLESMLCVKEEYCGFWKFEDNYIYPF